MLKKHLVVLLLMVMAVGVYAQSIPSGTGRYNALGKSPYILDAATDIYNNPVWTGYYRNYIFGDIGENVVNDFQLTGQYAGITFGVSKKLSLGLILNKRHDRWNDFNSSGFGWRPNTLGFNEPVVPITILLSYSLNKDFYVGLAPYIAMWSHEGVAGVNSDKSNANTLGASLGFMKMMKKGWVEGAIDFRMNSYKRDVITGASTETWKSEGGMELAVNLRAWIYPKSSSKIAIVPVLGFNTYSWNPRHIITTPAVDDIGFKYSNMGFNAGVGLNWPISDDIQIAFGLGGAYQSNKIDTVSSTEKITQLIAPQFNIAGETRIADWLTGRIGYSRGVINYKDETTAGSVSNSFAQTFTSSEDQTISLGTGFHFGRFSIDATVSEKWLKHGINFVSGNNTANTDLFGVVSASYNFSSGK